MSVSHAHTDNVSFDAEIKINCAKINSQAEQSKAYRRPAYAFPSPLAPPHSVHTPFIVNRAIVTRERAGGEGALQLFILIVNRLAFTQQLSRRAICCF